MPPDNIDHNKIYLCGWTTSQRELWPLHCLEANGASLNTGEFTELTGKLDLPAFIQASRETVDECEALRLQFLEGADGPSIRIAPLEGWRPESLDFSSHPDPRAQAMTSMASMLATPFDITKTLFSWTLIKLGPEHFIWCFIVHQLALDGSGRNIVARRLSQNYCRIAGGKLEETAPPDSLATLLGEDAAYRASEDFAASRAYWARLTADLPPAVRLTSKSSFGSYLGARYTAPLPVDIAASVRQTMARTGVSLSGLFAALSAIYLHCQTGVEDMTIGLLVSARTSPVLRNAPGNISNTVPLRVKIDGQTSLDTLIVQIRARLREALKHQRYPLSDIKAGLPGLTGELFSIAVNVMKFDYALEFGSAVASTHNLSNGPVDDLAISVFEQPGEDGLQVALNGNTERYTADALKTHFEALLTLLREICAFDLKARFGDIPLIEDAARQNAATMQPCAADAHGVAQLAAVRAPAMRIAPRTPREAMICRLFEDTLGADGVSIDDNFFEIGGHSLLAARLASRLSDACKSKIPLRRIFESPTPAALAQFLDGQHAQEKQATGKPPLILFPGGGVLTREVINLEKCLKTDFDVSLIDYPGWRSHWNIFFDFDAYRAFVLAQTLSAVPAPGPISLLGYSFGGGVAYALSAELTRLGYSVQFLGLIDSRSPVMKELPPAEVQHSLGQRIVDFIKRDRLSRSRQIGRYIGIRAKKPLIKTLLKWTRPLLPREQAGELSFYLTQFINASVPMQAIRDWARLLATVERPAVPRTILFRSTGSGDNWPGDLGWTQLFPELEIIPLTGDHFSMIADDNLPAIRAAISRPAAIADAAAISPAVEPVAPAIPFRPELAA